jgi:glycosidase
MTMKKARHQIIALQLIFCAFFFSGYSQQSIRVEPPNWWINMAQPDLQLMIHGENISSYDFSLQAKNIGLVKVNRVESPNYVFLDILIGPGMKAGRFDILLRNGASDDRVISYELKDRKSDPSHHQGFDPGDVVYLLMPDRFANGNPDNDSHPEMVEKVNRENPGGRHGGDIQGIIDHLGYISEMGATSIWINPLLENNMPSYSYHGYAITDFYKIDARFGTNQDYTEMVRACHDNGLKVIMDVVLNHCGSNHWWMADLPADDWIHRFDEFTRSNYRASAIPDMYAAEYDQEKMRTGWFDLTMPDMDHSNPFLKKYMIQNAIWWIEFSGIDGIRLDTQPYSDEEMVSDWAKRIRAEYPQFTIVGESWLRRESLTAYWQGGRKNHSGNDSNIPFITDFPLFFAVSEAFNESFSWERGLAKLYYVLSQDFLYPEPYKKMIFLDNHDLSRFYTLMGEDLDKFKLGTAFLLTTRGMPMIYYGTEILMTGEEHKGHGYIRTDFPGGWAGDKDNYFQRSDLPRDKKEAYDYLTRLLKWRKGNELFRSGTLKHFIPEDNVYVYFREYNKQQVMVVLNSNQERKKISLDRFAECISTGQTAREVITGKEVTFAKTLEVPAMTALIYEINSE